MCAGIWASIDRLCASIVRLIFLKQTAHHSSQALGLRGRKGKARMHFWRMHVNFPIFLDSMLRTDNSMFRCHYHILSGLLFRSLRALKHSQYTSTENCLHSLSSVFTTCLWNTGKSTLLRVLSSRLDGSLQDITDGFCLVTEQEDSSVSSNA